MGRKAEEKTLRLSDGNELVVRVTQLPAADAPAGLARAGRLFGPAFALLHNEIAAQAALASAHNDDDFQWLRAKFLAHSRRVWIAQTSAGGAIQPDTPLTVDAFDGELKAQMDWMMFCVRVNFADFFVVLGSSARPARQKTESPSSSPNGSTGSSGESSSQDASGPA